MPSMNDDSTSGPLSGSFLSENDSQSIYEEIPSRGFNRLVKVRRQGRWFMLKGLKTEFLGQMVYQELLKKEFELMAQLDHPNIAKANAKEINEAIGPCIVMEYIDGVTLDVFLDGKPSKDARLKVFGPTRRRFDVHSQQTNPPPRPEAFQHPNNQERR